MEIGQVSRPATSSTNLVAGRYELTEQLGRGGMGAAYRAVDHATGDTVALKTLELQTPIALKLFEREYQTLVSLSHATVVRVMDYGVMDDGRRYYTMELIEGADLGALAPMPWQQFLPHLRNVAHALSLLHARELVHRDISPRNIRIDEEGQTRLLDFGALAPFGLCSEVVGTPACIAPEALEPAPLDGRSDLFSLGVTAYLALSGRRPYAVRSLQGAAAAHAVPPEPLRSQLPDLPPALDDAVMSMLQIQPDRRLRSAADLIEQLSSLDGDLPERDSVIPATTFTSPALVGRERELQKLRQHLSSCLGGKGNAVVLEGAPRVGKTRLTEQVLVDARILGAVTVRVVGGSQGPGSAAYQQLVRMLLTAAPAEARATLAHEPLVAAMVNDAAPRLRPVQTEAQGSGNEAHRALQAAVVRWILALSKRRPLVIVVDQADMLDAASAPILFGVAHGIDRHPIMLTLALGGEVPPRSTLEQTVGISSRIKLRGLDGNATDTLVSSIFGDVPGRQRLSRWVQRVSGGMPGDALDLMEELVRRDVIRWLGGTWCLPLELPEAELPASIEEVIAGVLAKLPEESLAIAKAFALLHGSVPLGMCQALFDELPHELILTHCNRLVTDRILSLGEAGYRLAHNGYREAIRAGLAPSETQALHRRVGEALIEWAALPEEMTQVDGATMPVETIATGVQAGWHLLKGGSSDRGRDLIALMSLTLAKHGQGLSDAVPVLEDVVEIYQLEGRQPAEMLTVLAPLTLAGMYLNPALTYRYGLQTLEYAAELAGIDLAKRLSKVMPRRLALYLALGIAAFRCTVLRKLPNGMTFMDVLLFLFGLTPAIMGTASCLTDGETATRVFRRVEPLGWFPENHAASVAHHLTSAVHACSWMDYSRGASIAAEMLERLKTVKGLGSLERQQLEVGALLLGSSVTGYRADDETLEWTRDLEAIGTPTALETLQGSLAAYYAARGEMKLYLQARESLDVMAGQGGSPWPQDVFLPRALWWVEAQCEDALGLKRHVRQLAELASSFSTLEPMHAAAHACYLTQRGLADEALTRYGALLERVSRTCNLGERFQCAYVRVLRAAGKYEQAITVCREVLARVKDEERPYVAFYHGVQLELGRCLAAIGKLEEAAAYLDEVCDAQATHANPLIHALSYLARAEVAVLQQDDACFRQQMERTEPWMRATQYAPLFGLARRLQAQARAAGLACHNLEPDNDNAEVRTRVEEIGEMIAGCRGEQARQQMVLDLVIEHSGAAGGYLYLETRAGLQFVAPLHGTEPPDTLHEELTERVLEWHNLDCDETVNERALSTVIGEALLTDGVTRFEASAGSPYRMVLLTLDGGEVLQLVGVVALAEARTPLRPVPQPVVEAVAAGIYDAGDATVIRS